MSSMRFWSNAERLRSDDAARPGRRRFLGASAGAWVAGSAATLGARPSRADEPVWPTRAVRIIVPYPPGGATDLTGRIVAERFGPRFSQPFVVENRAGAGGILGTELTAKAAPDGYTICVSLTTSLLTNQFLYSKLPYDPRVDLAPVSLLADAPVTLACRPTLGPTTAPELIDYLRKHRGKASYGSWGVGSYAHLGGAYLSRTLDADLSHIAYKGEAAMLQDLVGGQIDFAFASVASARPYIDANRLTVLGVTGERRMAILPKVPTLAEQGVTDDAFKICGWVAMVAPAKTAPSIIDRLAAESTRTFEDPAVRQRIVEMGFDPVGSTPAAFRARYDHDFPIWKELVEISGARLD